MLEIIERTFRASTGSSIVARIPQEGSGFVAGHAGDLQGVAAVMNVGREVRRLVRLHVPSTWSEDDLDDDLRLMDGGLGLDSVAVVELLLACEERFAVPVPAELLAEPDLTLRVLVEHVQRKLAP